MSFCPTNLITKYVRRTPSYTHVLSKYFNNEVFKIDHWAHRSIGSFPIISGYQKMGYTLMDDVYHFPRFKATATWMDHPHFNNQRIFVSQYVGDDIPQMNSPKDYEDIYNKNQYLAWTLVFGNDINHMALEVKDIAHWYDVIRSDPKLDVSTDIQVSKDGDLLQFGLKSDYSKERFPDGSSEWIPSYFVEFVERKNGREGFESQNADVIFDSTTYSKS